MQRPRDMAEQGTSSKCDFNYVWEAAGADEAWEKVGRSEARDGRVEP